MHLLILSHMIHFPQTCLKIQTQKLTVWFLRWVETNLHGISVSVFGPISSTWFGFYFSHDFFFCKWFGVGYIFKHDVKPCVASSSTRGEQRPGHLEGTLHLLSAPSAIFYPGNVVWVISCISRGHYFKVSVPPIPLTIEGKM